MDKKEILEQIMATAEEAELIKNGKILNSNLVFLCESCATDKAHHMYKKIKKHLAIPEIKSECIFLYSEALDTPSGSSYLNTIPEKLGHYCDDCIKVYGVE